VLRKQRVQCDGRLISVVFSPGVRSDTGALRRSPYQGGIWRPESQLSLNAAGGERRSHMGLVSKNARNYTIALGEHCRRTPRGAGGGFERARRVRRQILGFPPTVKGRARRWRV
jgi:hypothetical protein